MDYRCRWVYQSLSESPSVLVGRQTVGGSISAPPLFVRHYSTSKYRILAYEYAHFAGGRSN